ncbi:MAG: hypothetical protein J07HB67_00521 [halophilic archaeon J07HB67]|jgi:hypothetical protein|nr:MAG: hypothetical protein J07HB67_00521 [halophilic archaeon J07HB67]
MVPETTTVELEGSTVRWTNDSFSITVAEAEAVADEVRELMAQPEVESVLVDNQAAEGTWPQETNEVWDELMAEMYEAGVASATLCPSLTNKMQVNRLSKRNGTDDLIRAFGPNERDEAREFVGLVSSA